MKQKLLTLTLVAALCQPTVAMAQQAPASGQNTQADAAADEQIAESVLTAEELDTLVAPIALYPDTLLLQILVAATFPVEIIMADRFVTSNADLEQDALTEAVDAQGWDLSVAVLASGFPTVLSDMAADLQWTETLGNAMLAQDEDVLDAVQRQRQLAYDAGVLATRDEQIVEIDEDDNIVVTPADPEVVYVPTYVAPTTTTTTTTSSSSTDWRDVALIFTTFALVGAIYRNNRNYYYYWGCRNCVGWRGRHPHYRYGRVNNGVIVVNPRPRAGVGRPGNAPGVWRPTPARRTEARRNIATDRSRTNNVNVNRNIRNANVNPTRGDQMRRDLERRSQNREGTRPGAGTGTRPGAGTGTPPRAGTPPRDGTGARPGGGAGTRPPAANQNRRQGANGSFQRDTGGAAVQRRSGGSQAAPQRRSGNTQAAPQRRSGGTQAAPQRQQPSRSSNTAFERRGSGPQAGAARQRGASSRGGATNPRLQQGGRRGARR